jgi:hypothetical protein
LSLAPSEPSFTDAQSWESRSIRQGRCSARSRYQIAAIPTHYSGQSCACIPPIQQGYRPFLKTRLIRGTAFSKEERRTFKLAGLLPSRINDLELQRQRYSSTKRSLLMIVEHMDNTRVTLPTFSRTRFSNLSMTRIKYRPLIRPKLMIGSLLQTFERSSQGCMIPQCQS